MWRSENFSSRKDLCDFLNKNEKGMLEKYILYDGYAGWFVVYKESYESMANSSFE